MSEVKANAPQNPSGAPRGPWRLTLGYVLLFLSTLAFDQTTKFHAESRYLTWSHESDIRSYRGSKENVFTLGVSPAHAREEGLAPEAVTRNWLDFHLTYVRNPGAAWGSFSRLPDTLRLTLFYGVTVAVGAVILYLFRTSHPGQRLARAALTLILAGAVGNLVDRLLLRYVIDWLQFHWLVLGWEYSFPVFNWADVAINVGLFLLVLDVLLSELALSRSQAKGRVPSP